MSACLIIQTPDNIFIGADSAISTTVHNQIYRLDSSGIKLHQRDNKVIFCSGDMKIAYRIMFEYQQSSDASIQNLKYITQQVCKSDRTAKVTVLVTEVDADGSVMHEITPENNFEMITNRMYLGQDGIGIWTAGIRTKESAAAAERFLFGGCSIQDTYRKVYETISYEAVGGFLNVKQVTSSGVSEILNEAINEKPDIKLLTKELYYELMSQHLIVGERIFGKILAGVNLIIDASDANGNKTFTIDSRGVTIAGMALTITGGLPMSQLDPAFKDSLVNLNKSYNGVVIDSENGLVITKSDNTIRTLLNATEGFSFEKKSGSVSSWEKMLFYEAATGNLKMNGEIDAKALKVKGVNVLTSNGKISTTGIETLEVGKNVIMGPDAQISWSAVSDKPYIPTLPSYIQQTKIGSTYIESPNISGGVITGGRIVGGSIEGGSITSNTSINVGTDVRVGDNIYLGNQSSNSNKRIYFNNGSYIWGYGSPGWSMGIRSDNLWIDSKNVEYVAGTKINFANAAITGLNVTAKFG